MAVIEVKTDIMDSITVSPIGQGVILVIMYVETFKTVVIVFIGNVEMHLMSCWLIIFSSINITHRDQGQNVKITEIIEIFWMWP